MRGIYSLSYHYYRAACGGIESIIAGGSAPAPWVHFFCSAKRNGRKKRPPGRFAAQTSRGPLCASLRPGARLTRRALNNAPRARSKVSRRLPASLGARLAPTGMGATHLQPARGGVFKTPNGAPEPRKALGERPEGVAHRDVRPGLSRGAGGVAGKVAPSGACFLWFLSLHEQRKKPARGAGNRH